MTSPFYGKYRGTVAANLDSDKRGRLQVTCPAVLGSGQSSWALPSVPYGGAQVGWLFLPPVGASIWVEFEGGDPDYPIWSGCFWQKGETLDGADPETRLLKTPGLTLTMDDTSGSGGLTIEVGSPAVSTKMTISLTSDGIELTIGSSKIDLSTTSVSINDGALEVV